jgi:hypothetical protein
MGWLEWVFVLLVFALLVESIRAQTWKERAKRSERELHDELYPGGYGCPDCVWVPPPCCQGLFLGTCGKHLDPPWKREDTEGRAKRAELEQWKELNLRVRGGARRPGGHPELTRN